MSWISKNYEKALLGTAVVLALALAWFGWSKFSQVDEDFSSKLIGTGADAVAVKDADLIPKAQSSHASDHGWPQATTDKKRPIDLFTGIPLFMRAGGGDPIDPLNDPPIHEPIPNKWWLENHIDPGYEDSPNRDPDGDGFSNLEEFTANTNPNDPKSVPALIAKLTYLRDESIAWVIRPGYESGGSFTFKYQDSKGGTNQTNAAAMIAPGALFFPKAPPMPERFKLLSSEVRREMSKTTHNEVEVTWVKIEDQKPNKKGMTYEFPAPLSEDRMKEYQKYDRTAVLALQALGMGSKEFKVEEFTPFAVPSDAAAKDYLLKAVSPASVTVEYTAPDGSKKTVDIPKGGLPKMPE